MTIRLNPANLSQTRSDLGLTVGTDVLAPNGSGANLTALNASNLATGTVPVARLGSGATATKFLRGDNTFQEVGGATELISSVTVTSSSPVNYVTFTPSSGWFDGTYREIHLHAVSVRPNANNTYLRFELAYNTASGIAFHTTTSNYRSQGYSMRGGSNSFFSIASNSIGAEGHPQDSQSDYLGPLRMDFTWFIDSTIGNLDNTGTRKNPMIPYSYYHGNSTSDTNNTMHLGLMTCRDGIGDITNATSWAGFRLKYDTSTITNGEFYLTGIKA